MSLINDALKRAKQAHEEKTPPPFQGAPLHTAPAPPRKSNLPFVLLGIAALFLILIGAMVLLFMRMSENHQPFVQASAPEPTASATPAPVAPAPVAQAAPPPAPAPVIPSTPSEPSVPPKPTAPASASTPEASSLQIMPDVKLQGILFSPTRPAAIINGRSLFVGDHIGDVRVIAIHQESATILWNGQTNELTMER